LADNKAFAKAVAPRKTIIFALQKSIKHLSLLVTFRQTMFHIKPLLSAKTLAVILGRQQNINEMTKLTLIVAFTFCLTLAYGQNKQTTINTNQATLEKINMERKLISTGSVFEKEVAFSRAVVVDKTVYVSGCTGYNYNTTTISDDIIEQTEQAFKNIEYALSQAGATFKDVVRVHYILADPNEFEKCWPTIRKYFESIKPACKVFCAKLTSEKIKIEIEVTAVKQ
jgi:enamine deaminase RidA (YjgF/YER057c/UK114 family)